MYRDYHYFYRGDQSVCYFFAARGVGCFWNFDSDAAPFGCCCCCCCLFWRRLFDLFHPQQIYWRFVPLVAAEACVLVWDALFVWPLWSLFWAPGWQFFLLLQDWPLDSLIFDRLNLTFSWNGILEHPILLLNPGVQEAFFLLIQKSLTCNK